MKKTAKIPLVLFFCVTFLLISSTTWAQEGGTLKGKVIDKDEKFSLPTVRITVAGAKKYGSTIADGTYVIEDILAGVYKVTFELPGYLTEVVKEVTIVAGQVTELNMSLKMGFAHEVSVTARREKLVLQKIPQNIEVITSTEIEEQPLIDIVHVLNNVTGFDVETGSGLSTVGTFMSINGYDDVYIKKMVDGVDIGETVTNWSMLNAYPEEMIDQIEVVKGGASSVWGANMGGIINLITKRPRDLERPVVTLRSTWSVYGEMDFEHGNAFPNPGTNYLQRYSANVMGNFNKFSYMVGYSHDIFDGFTDYSNENNYNIFTKFGYNFSDTTFLDLLYSYNKIGTQSHMFITSDAPPGSKYLWHNYADADAYTQVASLKFSTYIVPEINVEAQLKFNHWKYDGFWTYLEDAAWWEPPPGTVETHKFTDQKWGFTIKSSYRPGKEGSIVGGVDYYRIKADFTHIAFQPIIYVDEWAPFINAEYRIGSLGLHAGARYDYNSSFGSQLSPSLGANFNFLKSTLIRVNVARTFKVPDLWYTLGEAYYDMILPNPDLIPERAWAYSVGFESQELRYIWVKVSLFYHKMTDGIVQVPHELPGRYTWGNTDEFVRKGYEAEIGFTTDFGLSGYFGTNFNKHENITQDVRSTWIPTRSYKPRLKYKNSKLDLMINLQGRWLWWNEEDSPWAYDFFLPEDKKWLFDLRVSKGFNFTENTRLGLFVDIFNLTNQLYWDRLDSPNPRRWVAFGFELKFK